MTPEIFTKTYAPYAVNSLGFHPGICLTQSALESGWGEHAPGNAFFGIKDTDGVNGNEQLFSTTEVSSRWTTVPHDVGLETITKAEPTTIAGKKYFIYYGKGYFRKYNSPKECFDDHLQFFIKNSRYAAALTVKNNPEAFFREIAKAGYASAPNYADALISTYKKGILPYLK